MKKLMMVMIIAATALSANAASAKGCLKGAAIGAVAGHVAGKSKVKAAVVGCVVGRYLANRQKAKTKK